MPRKPKSSTVTTAPTPESPAIEPLLNIQYVELKTLIPYARNSRTHSPEQIEQIKVSFRTFGWASPMAVAGLNMLVGHARLQAAMEMAEAGETIRRNPDPWLGPIVDLSDLTPDEQRAYIIADNRLALSAGWDEGMLRLEVGYLDAQKFPDMAALGFTDKEMTNLLKEIAAPSDFNSYGEDIETQHECPRCHYVFSGGKTLPGTLVAEAVEEAA
jgi:hypothetical protein